mgnify:CR=1 FL=1
MPIYFRNAPVREPFIYDSIGNHWLQDATSRPNGYPFYHLSLIHISEPTRPY